MNNSDRSHKARVAFNASGYDDGDAMTNLYDLVCDLLHLADEYEADPRQGVAPDTETNGEFVGRMGLWHYREEVIEEALELGLSQS